MMILHNILTTLAISLWFDSNISAVEASRVLILGDSMGSFMGQTLESLCVGSEIQNAAIGGTTAVDWAEYDSSILDGCEGGNWDVVYISVGGNDVLNSGCSISGTELGEKVTSAVMNIMNNIAPNASKYLLTGYCIPRGNESRSKRSAECSEPSDYTAFQDFFLGEVPPTLPESVKVVDSTTVCGGGNDSFSNPIYFQDAIHLNSKGYCEVFTQPDIQEHLSCEEGDTLDCPSLDFELYGFNKHCSEDPDPPTTKCTDDPTWKFNGTNKKNCAWVRKKAGKRCNKEANGVSASTACPIACGSEECTVPECKDNTDWELELKNGKMKNCKYLKKKTSKRCDLIGTDNTFGYESCKQCNVCEY
mmetsp:Transcript_36590/g.44168  ORF Transcript_36590/g.44168 Transcript_36590/m.44168 type:complete len:361 (+) Transcript_36590:70-1152(+)